MKPRIDLITIWTADITAMRAFYADVLGFPVITNQGSYIEFASEGVRFAICDRAVMRGMLGEGDFSTVPSGQIVELAFACDSPARVDDSYVDLIARGAAPVQPPANMPWGQRTAFFADPDGNIHEIFANLEG